MASLLPTAYTIYYSDINCSISNAVRISFVENAVTTCPESLLINVNQTFEQNFAVTLMNCTQSEFAGWFKETGCTTEADARKVGTKVFGAVDETIQYFSKTSLSPQNYSSCQNSTASLESAFQFRLNQCVPRFLLPSTNLAGLSTTLQQLVVTYEIAYFSTLFSPPETITISSFTSADCTTGQLSQFSLGPVTHSNNLCYTYKIGNNHGWTREIQFSDQDCRWPSGMTLERTARMLSNAGKKCSIQSYSSDKLHMQNQPLCASASNSTTNHLTSSFSSSASVNCLATLPPPADEAATISLVFGRAAFVHIEFGSSDCAYPDSLPFRSDVLMLDACVHLAPFTQVSVSLNSSVFAKATVSNTGNSVNITWFADYTCSSVIDQYVFVVGLCTPIISAILDSTVSSFHEGPLKYAVAFLVRFDNLENLKSLNATTNMNISNPAIVGITTTIVAILIFASFGIWIGKWKKTLWLNEENGTEVDQKLTGKKINVK